MDEKDLIIAMLKQTADAIVNTFPRNCEAVVHDLDNFQRSIVHIAGNVTDREVGAPISGSIVKVLQTEGLNIKDRYNYKTITKDGRTLKTTTSFYRDSQRNVVCALCINFDTTDYINASLALDTFIETADFDWKDGEETFSASIGDTVNSLFDRVIANFAKQPSTMTTQEKISVVEALQREGVFQIKGAIEQVAMLLGVSKYTVYNYLHKIRAARFVNKI